MWVSRQNRSVVVVEECGRRKGSEGTMSMKGLAGIRGKFVLAIKF